MKGPQDSVSSASKALISLLSGLGENNFVDDITSISKSAAQQPADWGKLNETPSLLWEQLQPIFRVRDKIVRWVYDHLMVDAVANAIAAISTALDKLVYMVIGVFLGPVFRDISGALAQQADYLLIKDQEVRLQKGEQSIFEEHSSATDPTHSQLCKDHFDHDLNELAGKEHNMNHTTTDNLAGRVATIITTFAIKKIIEIWQPGSLIDVKPALASILASLHHPFNYSKDSEVQALMVAEVLTWCTTKSQQNPQAYAAFLQRLDRPHMAAKLNEEAEKIAHSHVPAFTAAYTSPDRVGGTTVHDLTTIGTTGAHRGFIERISSNIAKSLESGAIKGLTMEDLPGIKQIMESSPSSDTPNPIDQSLIRIPGISLLSIFDDIDIGEIVSAPGMGIVLKDAVIAMRLRDTEMVEREQIAAREKLGSLQDRPVKEMLALLEFGAKGGDELEREERERPTEESKGRRLMNKLKIGNT